MGAILFVFLVLVSLWAIAFFAIPQTFLELEGRDSCDDQSFKGLCHRFTLTDQNTWVAYLGKFAPANQYMMVSGRLIRKASGP